MLMKMTRNMMECYLNLRVNFNRKNIFFDEIIQLYINIIIKGELVPSMAKALPHTIITPYLEKILPCLINKTVSCIFDKCLKA